MARLQKSKRELEQVIFERCRGIGMDIHSVIVLPSIVHEWEANFTTESGLVTGYLPRFEEVVREVRSEFDLKEAPGD